MSVRHNGFAVVDVETTGFGKTDRIIEIGVVVLDERYRVVDEYETLIDPERDLGPTHVHGITPAMVSMAPSFADAAVAVAKRIENRIVVAHNLPFDERMLGQEFQRLGADFTSGLGVCTLGLTKQKLPAACEMLGLKPPDHHWALADARSCAEIVKAIAPQQEMLPPTIAAVPGTLGQRTHRRCADEKAPVMDRLLSRMVFEESDPRIVQYMDLLDWAFDDLILTEDERKHLNFLALELELTSTDVTSAHEQYFASMIAGAEKDGIITVGEHTALTSVARALGMSLSRIPAISEVNSYECDIPAGSAICFTGSFVDSDGNKLSKDALGSLAQQCGFTVVSSVTKSKCDCVVAVDPNSSSGKAKKARDYGKPVVGSDRFLEIVKQRNA